MTKKKFDLVEFRLGGYSYALPQDVAVQLFHALTGAEVYMLEERWEKGGTKHFAYLTPHDSMPSLRSINPASFHAALLAQEQREAEKAKDE